MGPLIMLLPILLLQLSGFLPIQGFTDCSEFFLGGCSGDDYAAFIKFNTGSQDKCSAHCSIEESCEFYRFEENPTQGVDCYLFNEPFRAYVNHCNLRGGPKREGADQGSSCFSPSGDTCEVAQQEDCIPFGAVTLTARCGLLKLKKKDAACTTKLGCSAKKPLVPTPVAQKNVDLGYWDDAKIRIKNVDHSIFDQKYLR